MKLRFQHICTFFIALSLFGCKQDPALFVEKDGLYFGTADTAISYLFAKYPNRTTDTIKVPVNVLGSSTSGDRPISFELVPESGDGAAIEGTHFKIPGGAVIPAKAIAGVIPVVVYRTADLESDKAVKLALRIKKDENFPAEGITTRQKLTINLAYLQKPASWGEFTGSITGFWAGYRTNFGTWTPTKYKLILDALYDPETGSTITEFPGSRFAPLPPNYNQYLAVVRNYIKVKYPGNYGLDGAVLIDPDNDNMPVQVGPANY
ncbi:DUF4843 domain-containing protein [Pedobacter nyackensis]|uniref:DUF4843 domain-containing protein n=1 Tax=Pedobacter nyackensis TaxID=475255 RepID=UPI0029318877|nr:DUF4843 domain-containing protein [Pedobacter nyackensis]